MKKTLHYSQCFDNPFNRDQALTVIANENVVNLIACILFDVSDSCYTGNIQKEWFDAILGGFSSSPSTITLGQSE